MRRLCLILAACCLRLDARSQTIARAQPPVRLVWYISLYVTPARKLAAEFSKRHPGISVDLARSSLLFEGRNEKGAHWEKADVVTDASIASRSELYRSGAFARLNLPAGLSPASCPWLRDPRGYYAYTHAAGLPLRFSISDVASYVFAQDAPDSLAALAQPRWKGKVALPAPSASFVADCMYRFVAAHPALGFAWLEKMRDNDVMLLFSLMAIWEALVSGVRSAIWGVPTFTRRERDISSGTSVGSRRPLEGSVVVLYATAINRRAPHPAAARVFVEWLIEPATQKYMVQNRLSYSLLEGACQRLERGPVCGRSIKVASPETEEFTRKVWKALLGDGHIAR